MSENGQKKPSSIAPPLLYCSCKSKYVQTLLRLHNQQQGRTLSLLLTVLYITVLIGLFFLKYTLKFINCLPNREFTV